MNTARMRMSQGATALLMLATMAPGLEPVSALAAPPPGGASPAQVGAQVGSRGDEVPPAGALSMPSASLPAPTPGENLVYFMPTDNDATATVLTLINTDTVDHTVALRGFSHDGTLTYSLNIAVPASSLRRMASDGIAASPPPSWVTPAPIITNFTDFTYFASLSLPTGVKAEGYTLFNPGTGTVDPRLDQGAQPLTFHAASPLLPGAPVNLTATVSGGTATISWSGPSTGGLATSYVLEAGSASGAANLATVAVSATSFVAPGIPRGTYFLRVKAVNAVGTGPASAEVTLVVP